jgi:hypothetical protein
MKLRNLQKKFAVLVALTAIALMTFTPVCLTASAAPGSRPPAQRPTQTHYSANLQPVGDEPRASGVVNMTLTHMTASGAFNVSVSCDGLRPGARYMLRGTNGSRTIDSGPQTADASGTVKIAISGKYGDNANAGRPSSFQVYRIEPRGNVRVLAGHI